MLSYWFQILIIILVSYYLGNINGAVSVSTLLKDDVRNHGSGNAGLTNFVRNFGGVSALFVLLIDVSKSILACLVGRFVLEPYGYGAQGTMIAAIAVSIGHDFPALLGFHGGKGILCGISVAFMLDWRCALIILAAFLVFFLPTGYVSLGSVMGALAFCITFAIFHIHEPVVAIGGVFVGALAIFMHRGNIARLCKGTERKTNLFGRGKVK